MCKVDEPNKPQKPLTDLQTWGDEDMPCEVYDDELIEELLADEMDMETRATESVQLYETCPECGEPENLCRCP